MRTMLSSFCIVTLCLTACISSHSQSDIRIAQIKNYCDSLDKLTNVQNVRKTGAGVALEYYISDGSIFRIIEKPTGYRYISAKVNYYLQDNNPVYVDADIEISGEEGASLTIELQKIYLDGTRIIKQLESKRSFDPDSLYNNPDPVKTALGIRKNAVYEPVSPDTEFERTLLRSIGNYLDALDKKDGDPIFELLFSPFI